MAAEPGRSGGGRRLSTETRRAPLTTEFWVYVVMVIATLIAADNIGGGPGGHDYFTADKAWLYVILLTIGYMLARGWAKSGVRERYWDAPDDGEGGEGAPLGERLKAAASVIKEGEPSSRGGLESGPAGSTRGDHPQR